MNLPPPPQLRGILASALFVLLAVSVNENAAAQVSTCTNPSNNPDASPGDDPHDTAINAANSCAASHQFIDAFPNAITCGECIPDSDCSASARPGGLIYRLNGNRFCGDLAQCAAAGGTRDSDNANCAEIITTAHHQACYDADFSMPIAARAFSGTPGTGDCRAAAAADAEVGGACRLIDPDGSGSLMAGDFTGIIDGHCALAGNSPGCSNIGPGLPGFRLQPDFLDQGQRENVGRCVSAGACANIYDGFANTENNRCILPREESECPSSTPLYDSAADRCVEATDANCARLKPSTPNGFGTVCLSETDAEEACREGINAGGNPHEQTACVGPNHVRLTDQDQESSALDAQCGACSEVRDNCTTAAGTGVFSSVTGPWVLYTHNSVDFCGPTDQCERANGIRDDNQNCAGTVCLEGFTNIGTGSALNCVSYHQACYNEDFRRPISNSNTLMDCRAAEDNMADREICATIDPDGSTQGPGRYTGVLGGACATVPEGACFGGNGGRYHPDLFFDRSAGTGSVGIQDVGLCVTEGSCVGGISSRGILPGVVDGNICRPPQDDSECTDPARPKVSNGECVNAHQACYNANFRMPIADDTAPGGCRAAEDTSADRAVCSNDILGDPIEAGGVNYFMWVTEGACAVVSNLAGCVSGGNYIITLEDALEPYDVWRCESETTCRARGWFYGPSPLAVEDRIASQRDTEEYPRCYPDPADNAGCQEINPATPYYDASVPSACRLPSEENGNMECASLDPNRPIFDADEDTNCRPAVIGDCAVDEEVSGGRCIACGSNQVRASGESSCSCRENYADSDTTTPELTCTEIPTCTGQEILNMPTNSCLECDANQHAVNGACVDCPTDQVRAGGESSCSCREGYADSDTTTPELTCTEIPDCTGQDVLNVPTNSCEECDANQHAVGGACVDCGSNQVRASGASACTCQEDYADSDTTTPELTCTEIPDCTGQDVLNVPTNSCEECDENDHAVNGACVDCPPNEVRAAGVAMCSCQAFTNPTDMSCVPFAECDMASETLNAQNNTCIPIASCTPPNMIQQNNVCEPDADCDGENQVRVVATNTCDCESGYEPMDSTDPLNCIPVCVSPDVRQADGSCAENIVCTEANQERNPDTNMCRCEEGFTDRDDAPEILDCEMIPVCDTATETLNQADNMCVPLSSCVLPNMFQENGACEPDVVCTETGQGRNAANNECEVCGNARKLSDGDCVALTAADCLPAERFEGSACVLPEPGEWPTGATAPPYGEYEHGDCTGARWPWSIVQTADGLSEICHAPVNLLATDIPSSQTLDSAEDKANFCVLRGAASGDSVRCDDPTVFGNLGIPDAPAGLVTQTTATITITLSDGATREASVITAEVANYLEIVQVSGSVVAVLPPDTTAAEITTARPLVGTISMSMAPPATNTMTLPPATNTVTPPAAGGGGGGGGGGGAAAALIAVPVVLLGGYWLLGGFDYIDPTYNLNYSGENSDFTYRGDAGFELNHGSLSSYARAIQSNGDAVAYQSGISYGKDLYSLNYAAYESKSIYDYDLSARLNYGSGPWSISPTADAEFNYSADSEDWTSTAGAGLTAAWISHKWNVRAHSAFAGDLNHGLDVEFRF